MFVKIIVTVKVLVSVKILDVDDLIKFRELIKIIKVVGTMEFIKFDKRHNHKNLRSEWGVYKSTFFYWSRSYGTLFWHDFFCFLLNPYLHRFLLLYRYFKFVLLLKFIKSSRLHLLWKSNIEAEYIDELMSMFETNDISLENLLI